MSLPGSRRKTSIRKRVSPLLLILAALLLLPLIPDVRAAAADPTAAAADVIELDIGIRPAAFRKLIEDESEPVFRVQIASGGGPLLQAKISLRGAASKAMGLASPTKRIPLELRLDPDDALARALGNTEIKLINGYTPFRLLAEYTSLELFRTANVPVSAHSLVFLRFNGVDFGLYLAAEKLNETFLDKHFPGGALYKSDAVNFEKHTSLSSWFGSLRLTAGEDTGRLDALIGALKDGEGYEDLLDVDEILRFFACLAVYGADSTFLTEQNNFYLCDTGEKFLLLPWDNSEAFAGYDTTNGIDRYRMDPWEDMDYPPPLFTLLMENEANRARYHDYIRQLNEGFLSPAAAEAYLNGLASDVKPYLERDATMFFNEPFELPLQPAEEKYGSLESLLGTFLAIHNNLADQLNGKTDVFHSSDMYWRVGAVFSMYDTESIMKFMLQNSPSADPGIAEKICSAYPAWCRSVGKIPVDADDPLEIALSAGVFCAAFLLAVFLSRRRRGKPTREQNEPTGEATDE